MRGFDKTRSEENLIGAVFNLLRILNISYSKKYVAEYLKTHPDYPSMFAFSSILTEFKIENGSFKIDDKQLMSYPSHLLSF